MGITSIQCYPSLLSFLKSIGKKGESYHQIIIRIANEAGYKDELKKHGLKVEN